MKFPGKHCAGGAGRRNVQGVNAPQPIAAQTADHAAALLSPREAADRLLEAASLQAYRSAGVEGLTPLLADGKPAFRAQDVDGYIARRLQGAASYPTVVAVTIPPWMPVRSPAP